jgi:ketosteroid isomerase-like protein
MLRTTALIAACASALALAAPADDGKIVSQLDLDYQAAVKRNDADAMAKILAGDMVLVTGRGVIYTRADLIEGARKANVRWEQQDEVPGTQKVRVWGDTAVVTAKLWLKGNDGERDFDYQVWFSDTYVRIDGEWRYAFGQASIPL